MNRRPFGTLAVLLAPRLARSRACTRTLPVYPARAYEIQQSMGSGGCGFDLNVAHSSATLGIQQAVSAAQLSQARYMPVVNTEVPSVHLERRDRGRHFHRR